MLIRQLVDDPLLGHNARTFIRIWLEALRCWSTYSATCDRPVEALAIAERMSAYVEGLEADMVTLLGAQPIHPTHWMDHKEWPP